MGQLSRGFERVTNGQLEDGLRMESAEASRARGVFQCAVQSVASAVGSGEVPEDVTADRPLRRLGAYVPGLADCSVDCVDYV
jgi:hypothetical protein